jgi:hypothetical protein
VAKKKKTRRQEVEDDDLPDDDFDGDDDIARRRKPKDDAWTGLLVVSVLALIGATVLFYLDHAALSAQQVQPPSFRLPGLAPAAAQTPQG